MKFTLPIHEICAGVITIYATMLLYNKQMIKISLEALSMGTTTTHFLYTNHLLPHVFLCIFMQVSANTNY